jgi:hypothetical protein
MTQSVLSRKAPIPRADFEKHARAITVLMNAMFVRHLVALYGAFEGDLVAVIVLGEVAHHNLASLINRAGTPRELSALLHAREGTRQQALLPTNAFSIAQATGIPRETVRRKVASLTRRGWLEKDAGGNLYVAAEAAAAFADFNYGRVGDLLDVAHAIDALIADHPPAGRRRPEGSRTRPTPGPASR